MTKYIHFSGGGTKGIGQLGFYSAIHGHMHFNVGSGVSIGAAILLPCLMGKHQEAVNMFDGIELSTFFNVPPVNERGKLTLKSVWRAIRGKSLGDQDNLVVRMREIVTEEEFEEWKALSGQRAYVGSVDLGSGKQVVRALHEMGYEDMLMAVLASASIPVYTEPVTHFGLYEYDGGIRSHIIAWDVLKMEKAGQGSDDEAESLAVFTRPENHRDRDLWRPASKRLETQASILSRTIDVMNREISKNDETLHEAYCWEHGLVCRNIFLPSLLKSPYDVDENRLQALYYEGIKLGEKYLSENVS